MGKGRKSMKRSDEVNSSKKRLSKSKSKENNSSFEEIKTDSKKVKESNNNFIITVYKLNNGQYSLYNNNNNNNNNNSSPNLIINNNNSQNIFNQNVISNENNNMNIQISIPKFNDIKDDHPVNYSLNFKNKNFESKLRAKTEKNYRNSKNMKNLGKEGKDAISYKIYCDIEAGPSILPKKKYCDFTGLTSNYNELHTGIRYYNSKIYKMSQNIPQPIKDQYLNIRKALIRLK